MAVVAFLLSRKHLMCHIVGVVFRPVALPVLVVVTDGGIDVALDLLEILAVVGIDRQQAVHVLLWPVAVVQTARSIVRGGSSRNIGGAFSSRQVDAHRGMQFQVGQEVELVVYVKRGDESCHRTFRIVLVSQSFGVANGSVGGLSVRVNSLVVSAKSLIVHIDGNGGVESGCGPDGTTVVELVAVPCAFGIEGQPQVVVEQ